MKKFFSITIFLSFLTALCFAAGNFLYFDGVDDFIEVQGAPRLQNLGPLTVLVWINPQSAGRQRIVGNRTAAAGSAGWLIDIPATSEKIRFEADYDTIDLVRQTDTIANLNGFNSFVAVTWDGTVTAANTHIYIGTTDGRGLFEPTYQTTTNGSVATHADDSANNLRWGTTINTASDYLGYIGPTRIYNRVLTLQEIYESYTCSDYITSGLVGYWTFWQIRAFIQVVGDVNTFLEYSGNKYTTASNPSVVVASDGPATNFCNNQN